MANATAKLDICVCVITEKLDTGDTNARKAISDSLSTLLKWMAKSSESSCDVHDELQEAQKPHGRARSISRKQLCGYVAAATCCSIMLATRTGVSNIA